MTATRHPVAELLNDEMRARVRAATFVRTRDGRIAARASNGRNACPLALALGLQAAQPAVPTIFGLFGLGTGRRHIWQRNAVRSFANAADFGDIDPADVKTMLGCEP
jgi:hypothetical protein